MHRRQQVLLRLHPPEVLVQDPLRIEGPVILSSTRHQPPLVEQGMADVLASHRRIEHAVQGGARSRMLGGAWLAQPWYTASAVV